MLVASRVEYATCLIIYYGEMARHFFSKTSRYVGKNRQESLLCVRQREAFLPSLRVSSLSYRS